MALLRAACVLMLLLANSAFAYDFGASYSSDWESFRLKFGRDSSSDPFREGSLRLNRITLHDRTGFLRMMGIFAGSVSQEVGRRESEAAASGGYYERRSGGLPPAVAGGEAQLSLWFGGSEQWNHVSLGYTDGLDPNPIGLGLWWSIDAQVRMGFYRDNPKNEAEWLIRLLNVGPKLGWSPGEVGGFVPSLVVGARIDPLFKPIVGLVVETGHLLDVSAYARAEIYLGWLVVGGEVTYDYGYFVTTPSNSLTFSARAGLMF